MGVSYRTFGNDQKLALIPHKNNLLNYNFSPQLVHSHLEQ
jgi:hypothetical protein